MTHHDSSRPRLVPTLLALESRDVPATFYVDPLFAANANGDVVTFNAFAPGSVAGRVVGTDAFATLTAALTKAAANAEADTILLARSRFDIDGGAVTGNDLVPNVTPVDNTGGPILIDDNITLVGSGVGATVLAPTADTGDNVTGVFEVASNRTFAVRDLSLDGTGFKVGVGFRFGSTVDAGVIGVVERVEVTNIGYDLFGTGIGAYEGANLTVADSKVSGYARIGVLFEFASGSVTGTTITGKGAGTTFVNYGVQLSGNAHAVLTGNTITGNTASTPDPFLSAGVNMFEDAGAAPTATLTKNTISGNTFGIRVGGNFGVDRSLASLHDNNLPGNYLAIQADNVAPVDATNNWYGDASGPFQVTANPNGKGSEVTDQVNFAPFRTTPFVETTVVVQVVEVPVPGVDQPVPTPRPVVPAVPTPFAVGGSGNVAVLDASFASVLSARPFGAFAGEVRVARADVTGDGIADVIAAAGPGGGPQVVVIDGSTGQIVRSFYAFDKGFSGGVFVAAADVSGDGVADIVVGAGAGGGSNVRVYDGASGILFRSFFAYAPQFTGGVTVAAGDMDGDGFADIVTGAGAGGGSHVEVFSGASPVLLRSFFAYAPQFTGGIYVAVGDVNGDGFLEIVTGAGAGGGSNVRIYDGPSDNLSATLVNSFYADSGVDRGIRVAAEDLDGDGKDDLVFGPGSGGDNRVRVTFATALATGNPVPAAASQPLFGTTDGLNVG